MMPIIFDTDFENTVMPCSNIDDMSNAETVSVNIIIFLTIRLFNLCQSGYELSNQSVDFFITTS